MWDFVLSKMIFFNFEARSRSVESNRKKWRYQFYTS